MTYPETGHPDWNIFQPIEVEVLWTTPVQSWQEVSRVASNQLIDRAVALGAEALVFEKTFVQEDDQVTSVVSKGIALGGGSPKLLQEIEAEAPESIIRIKSL